MTYLLDTNVISELRKAPGVIAPNVEAWVRGRSPESLFLSAITVMELEIGVRRAERRDPSQGARLREWLEGRVLTAFADRVLPIDTAVALRTAAVHVPDPSAERDALIAGTALVHRLTVVTRNVKDFRSTGVQVISPWD